MNFYSTFKNNFNKTLNKINYQTFDNIIDLIINMKKKGGRLFFLGVGGSAANASHAVNDFRKLCNIETYNPLDNVSEVTARTNDEGWETVMVEWLRVSKLSHKDIIFIFSVGGGNLKRKVSLNIINAIKYAKKIKAKSIAIVAKKDGYAAKNVDLPVILEIDDAKLVTPVSETIQAYIWHLLVTSPRLQKNKTKW
ncbi:phosphoheptose isomerase [alpha proteobacterium HIMB114]|nr:phosphoheptose isomerase [alpha proteobacterium HIMB114]